MTRKGYSAEQIIGKVRESEIMQVKDPLDNPRQIRPEMVEKILHLRTQYHLGPQRIAWYLERYHGFPTSRSSVYRTLVRKGMPHSWLGYHPLPREVPVET